MPKVIAHGLNVSDPPAHVGRSGIPPFQILEKCLFRFLCIHYAKKHEKKTYRKHPTE
jgi:hypothetical protein